MRFIDGVRIADKAMDIIPLVSTIKNACIILYRDVHKVATEALNIKPQDTSAWDDVKITMLSKNCLWTWAFAVPVLGNLAALIKLAIDYCQKANPANRAKGTLGTAIQDASNAHKAEVVRLYFARNPECSVDKIFKNLQRAIHESSAEVVELLLKKYLTTPTDHNRPQRLPELLLLASNQDNPNIFKIVLEKLIDKYPDNKEVWLDDCLSSVNLCPPEKSKKNNPNNTVILPVADILLTILEKKTTPFSTKTIETISKKIAQHGGPYADVCPLSLLLASDKFVLTQEQAQTLFVNIIERSMYKKTVTDESCTVLYNVPEALNRRFGQYIDAQTLERCFEVFLTEKEVNHAIRGKIIVKRYILWDLFAIKQLSVHTTHVTPELLTQYFEKHKSAIFRLHGLCLRFFIDKIPDTVQSSMKEGIDTILTPRTASDNSSVLSLFSDEICGQFVDQALIDYTLMTITDRHVAPRQNNTPDYQYQWNLNCFKQSIIEILVTYKGKYQFENAAKYAKEKDPTIHALFVQHGGSITAS